jgi:hypothetical protein
MPLFSEKAFSGDSFWQNFLAAHLVSHFWVRTSGFAHLAAAIANSSGCGPNQE